MNGSHEQAINDTESGTSRRTGCATRQLLLLGLFALVLVGAGLMMSDGAPSDDGRAAALVLQPDELSEVAGRDAGEYRHTSPPIDIGMAERAARAATNARVPAPGSRHLATSRNTTSGAEVTQAVLVFDNPRAAADLAAVAAPLLGSTFGLMSEPVSMANVDEALLWHNARYRALTFRRGGAIVLVGTTDTGSGDTLDRWARRVLDKVLAQAKSGATPPTP